MKKRHWLWPYRVKQKVYHSLGRDDHQEMAQRRQLLRVIHGDDERAAWAAYQELRELCCKVRLPLVEKRWGWEESAPMPSLTSPYRHRPRLRPRHQLRLDAPPTKASPEA